MGELNQATPYALNVDTTGVIGKTTAITIEKISSRDKFQAAETVLVAAATRSTFTDTAGLRIDRIIIRIHPPTLGVAELEVVQGSLSFKQTANGDIDLVFTLIA